MFSAANKLTFDWVATATGALSIFTTGFSSVSERIPCFRPAVSREWSREPPEEDDDLEVSGRVDFGPVPLMSATSRQRVFLPFEPPPVASDSLVFDSRLTGFPSKEPGSFEPSVVFDSFFFDLLLKTSSSEDVFFRGIAFHKTGSLEGAFDSRFLVSV